MEISMDQDHFNVLMKAIKNQIALTKGNIKKSSDHTFKQDKHQKDLAILYHLEQEFFENFTF